MLTLSSLPADILIIVLESLGIPELLALSMTCHLMNSIVAEYGWASYLRSNPRPSCSLSQARNLWLPRTRARYDVMTDASWGNMDFIARPLSRIWNGRLQPILAISPSRLLVAAGSNLYSYSFGKSDDGSAASPPISFEGSVSLLLGHQPERPRNITALAFVEDRGLDRTLDVAFQDGGIERVFLHSVADVPDGGTPQLFFTRNNVTPMPDGDFVESISSESNIVLALSSNGHARLCAATNLLLSGPSNPHQHRNSILNLQARSWVSYLCLQSSTPYAAFGTSSTTPLNVHSLTDGGILSEQPTAILHTQKATLDKLPSSAVYGLARGPLNSPWGASPQILVSGWYDGQVRCYDLRASDSRLPARPSLTNNESGTGTSTSPNPLRPVLSLADRWSYEPIYSVACGGGSAAHIAAGTARHSVVSFWDVRSPTTGWSVRAPGNDPSPVYSVILESSRFFGATQSRPFVYDFGPGVSLDTYPTIPQVRGIDGLKQKKGSHRATYHVLRYAHNGSGLCNDH